MTDRSKNIFVVVFSCIVGIYLGNMGLIVIDALGPGPVERDVQTRQAVADKQGTPFDGRSREEVLAALRKGGRNVETLAFPASFLNNELEVDGEKVIPLSSVPNVTVVHSNECGYYPVYEIDERGFNNPRGVHSDDDIEIALLGDSFAFGFSVDWQESVGGQLAALGLKNVSFGHGGNGPMITLATLSEYATAGRYRHYVWLYCGWNDLDDLLMERNSTILWNYLEDPDYRQDLVPMSESGKVELRRRAEAWQQRSDTTFFKVIMDVVLLRSLRGRLGLSVFAPRVPAYSDAAQLLARVLFEAKKRIEAAGGKLLVVYLPSVEFFQDDHFHKYAMGLSTIKNSGADFLDMTPVFEASGDPLQYFPYRMPGHYNPKGYALLAREIRNVIQGEQSEWRE